MPFTLRFPAETESFTNVSWEELLECHFKQRFCRRRADQVMVVQSWVDMPDDIKFEVRLERVPEEMTGPEEEGFKIYSSWDAWHIQPFHHPFPEPQHNPPGGWLITFENVRWAVRGIMRNYREDILIGHSRNREHFFGNGQLPPTYQSKTYNVYYYSHKNERDFIVQVTREHEQHVQNERARREAGEGDRASLSASEHAGGPGSIHEQVRRIDVNHSDQHTDGSVDRGQSNEGSPNSGRSS